MIFIYITCKDKKEAKRIGRCLVEKKLAVCVNYYPIDSIYWWEGKVVDDKEVVLIVKTVRKKFEKINKEIKKLHSYNTPFIGEIKLENVNKSYLSWLKKMLK